MKLIKNYQCDSRTPSDDEIQQAINISNSENCIVKLSWFFPYSGNYSLSVYPNMSFEECKNKLPKTYPV